MWLRHLVGASVVLGAWSVVLAQVPSDPVVPRFWLGNVPQEGIVADAALVPQVRVMTSYYATATDAAWAAHMFIRDHQLGEGQVTIVPWFLGRRGLFSANQTQGTYLWCHPDDALAKLPADVPEGFPTPWTAHGINGHLGTGPWIDEFLAAYKGFSDPRPVRFSLDSEVPVVPDGHAAYHLYVACQSDPRWATEPLAGFPPGTTMASLVPPVPYDDTIPFSTFNPPPAEITNKIWYNWFEGIMAQIMDGATSKAVYERVRHPDNFPDCVCGDYNASFRVDGIGNPRRVVRPANYPGLYWNSYSFSGSGQMQPISFYNVHEMFAQPGDAWSDATVRFWGQQVDACIDSFGGGHDSEISFWITSVGLTPTGAPAPATKDDIRQFVAFGHSRRVRDYDIFNGPAQPQVEWTQTAEAINEARSCYLSKANLPASLYGTTVNLNSTQVESLRYGFRDLHSVAAPQTSPGDVSIEATFDTIVTSLGCTHLEAIVEAKANTPSASLTVWIFNVHTNAWDLAGTSFNTEEDLARVRISMIPRARHVSSGSTCRLRFDYHSIDPTPLQVDFDLIQLIGIQE